MTTDTLAGWSFENLNGTCPIATPCASTSFASTTGTRAGSLIRSKTSGANTYAVGTGNGSRTSVLTKDWEAGNPAIIITLNTQGYQNLNLSWDQGSSNAGPRDFTLAYGLDGTNYTSIANYTIPNYSATSPGAWSSSTYNSAYFNTINLSTITALNNKATVYFRLSPYSTTSASGSTISAGGYTRIDNVTFTGTAIPATPVPGPLPALGGLAAFATSRRLRKRIQQSESCDNGASCG